MASNTTDNVLDDLLELLAEGASPERLMDFRLPDAAQKRLDELLEKNRTEQIDDADRAELNSYEQLEHVVRLLKAKLFARQQS